MILSDVVNVKISNNQIKYYRNLGYDVNGGNEIKEIKVKDLPYNSGTKIRVKCDICGTEKKISLYNYKINTNNFTTYYACSRKCSEQKNIDTILKKYGVDNISKLDEIKKKKINTCLMNNGVDHPQQSDIIYNKSKKSKEDKYNNEYYNNKELAIITKTRNIIKKYNALDYTNDCFTFYCNKGHEYQINTNLFHNRKKIKTELCTICNPYKSNISPNENFLYDFITENYDGKIIKSDRSILSPKELDVYLPELNLAFEYNGLFWHNELNQPKNYHLTKTEDCLNKNIQLIHIYSDDWLYKKDIVKSMILHKLGKSNKIYARKCEIRMVEDTKDFLNTNHIQGFINSSIRIGLYYNNELVSLMTFGKKRIFMNSSSKDKEYEMLRFCNKLNNNVIGGASKLFNYFINKYDPIEVITYANRSYSNGSLYKSLNFEYIGKTSPNYYYIINDIRNYRYNYRKDKLIKEGYDPNKTEKEIMLDRKIYRIYDSGNLKYRWKKL